MKLRYKTILDREWTEIEAEKLLKAIRENPSVRFEVKACCVHRKKRNMDGVTSCERCHDELERTSYRD
jgi:ribosomal protein L37AE/L43A